MRSLLLPVVLVGCALAVVPALTAVPAFADTQQNAVVALHVQPHAGSGSDPCSWAMTPCSDYDYLFEALGAYDIHLVLARGQVQPGLAAVSCGIAYNENLQVFGWTLCASGQEWPNAGANGLWPASGGGNRITWDKDADCQVTTVGADGVHALAGAFYVYAYGPSAFEITPNMNLQSGPEYQVGDCNNSITDLLTQQAWVGFGLGPRQFGCNPCNTGPTCPRPVPVQPSTWGAIKSKY